MAPGWQRHWISAWRSSSRLEVNPGGLIRSQDPDQPSCNCRKGGDRDETALPIGRTDLTGDGHPGGVSAAAAHHLFPAAVSLVFCKVFTAMACPAARQPADRRRDPTLAVSSLYPRKGPVYCHCFDGGFGRLVVVGYRAAAGQVDTGYRHNHRHLLSSVSQGLSDCRSTTSGQNILGGRQRCRIIRLRVSLRAIKCCLRAPRICTTTSAAISIQPSW